MVGDSVLTCPAITIIPCPMFPDCEQQSRTYFGGKNFGELFIRKWLLPSGGKQSFFPPSWSPPSLKLHSQETSSLTREAPPLPLSLCFLMLSLSLSLFFFRWVESVASYVSFLLTFAPSTSGKNFRSLLGILSSPYRRWTRRVSATICSQPPTKWKFSWYRHCKHFFAPLAPICMP